MPSFPVSTRTQQVVEDAAPRSRIAKADVVWFPAFFRYGRQVALASWHLRLALEIDGAVGVGVVPGYGTRPDGSLRQVVAEGWRARSSPVDVTARAAVDTAVLDAVGWETAGLRHAPVRLEGMIWSARPEVLEARCHSVRAAGLRSVKLKLTGGAAADRTAIVTACDVFGGADVRLDANRAYTDEREVLETASFARDRGCVWFEEPAKSPVLWRALARHGALSLVLDESALRYQSLDEARATLRFSGVNVKLARVGGPVTALRLVDECLDRGLEPFIGCSEDLWTGMSAVLHVASATLSTTSEGWGAERLGITQLDTTIGPVTDGAVASWEPLGSRRPRAQALRRTRSTGPVATVAVGQGVRVAQAFAARSLRCWATLRDRAPGRARGSGPGGRVLVLSPELGWRSAPHLGGSRYERIAAALMLGTGKARLLLPAREMDEPLDDRVGRLWLPRGNRRIVLAAYLPFQLLMEIHRRRPAVVRAHSVPYLGLPSMLAVYAARVTGWDGALLVHVHHLMNDGTPERRTNRFARALDGAVLRRADRVVTLSESTRAAITAQWGVPLERIAVAPLIAERSRASLEPPAPRPRCDETVRLAFVGQMIDRKDPHAFMDVAEALRARRPVRATRVGDGGLASTLRSRISDLEWVEHYTAVPDVEVVLRASDVLVCTSEAEGFYLAGLDALRSGCPIFGYALPALLDLVGDELACCLSTPGSVDAAADRLADLDRHELDALRLKAWKRSFEFDATSTSEQFLRILGCAR